MTRFTARIDPATGLWGRPHTPRPFPMTEAPGPYLGVRDERTERRGWWSRRRQAKAALAEALAQVRTDTKESQA